MKRAKICAGTFVTCQMKVPLKGPRGNFVREKVDVIVAFENQTVRAAKAATSEVPILFLHVLTDPVGEGFVQSLAHPGGNITGIFHEFFRARQRRTRDRDSQSSRLERSRGVCAFVLDPQLVETLARGDALHFEQRRATLAEG